MFLALEVLIPVLLATEAYVDVLLARVTPACAVDGECFASVILTSMRGANV